jgi:hypothetical protein
MWDDTAYEAARDEVLKDISKSISSPSTDAADAVVSSAVHSV